jgi:TolB-like protein
MSDVFISYARSTAREAKAIAEALRGLGYGVWRDDELPAHKPYAEVIEERLKAAKAVVVVWSAEAVKSEWVQSEADRARMDHKLVQLSVDGAPLPMPFDRIQCADLSRWKGDHRSPAWKKVTDGVAELVNRPVPEPSPPVAPPRKAGRSLGWAAAGVLLLALVVAGAWLAHTYGPAAPEPTRIALLPFRAVGSSAQAKSVAASLTEKLQAALPNGPFEVAAADDAAALTGADRDAAARRLGIGLTLGGDVEDDGDRIEASLRLDDVVRHVTLWSSQSSGSASDPESLTTSTGRLALRVLGCARSALRPTGGLRDTQALALFFKACELDANINSADPQSLFQTLDVLRRVIARAPGFGPAHSLLATTLLGNAGVIPPAEQAPMFAEARNEANRALALDPNDVGADDVLEELLPVTDWGGREALLGRALQAQPDSAISNSWMGGLLADEGRFDEAVTYVQKAAAADPFNDDYLHQESEMLVGAGRSQQANLLLAQSEHQTPRLTNDVWGYELLDYSQEEDWDKLSKVVDEGANAGWLQPSEVAGLRDLVEAGKTRSPAAIAKAKAEFMATAPHGSPVDLAWSIFQLSSIGLVDDAYALAATYTPRPYFSVADPALFFLPAAAPMRRDPRFMPWMQRLGLLQYWRSSGKWPDFCREPGLPYDCKAEAARLATARS